MRRSVIWPLGLAAMACVIACEAVAQTNCADFDIDPTASVPLHPVADPAPQSCATQMSNGFPIPDPNCTPGAINPTLTVDILRNPNFRTRCVREQATTEQQKATTYSLYNIPHPTNNTGASQTCELDHLISLELGGADTLDNIWPQCGPSEVSLSQRFFKEKDGVENYLAKLVRNGQMDLGEAQRGIATDWTQYLDAARQTCPGGRC
jgi:hypothetical protein